MNWPIGLIRLNESLSVIINHLTKKSPYYRSEPTPAMPSFFLQFFLGVAGNTFKRLWSVWL